MPAEKLAFDFSAAKTLCLRIEGDWRISAGLPALREVTAQLDAHQDTRQVVFQVADSLQWDSAFIAFLFAFSGECKSRKIAFIPDGLPGGVRKLMPLALKAKGEVVPRQEAGSFLENLGGQALSVRESLFTLLDFLGEVVSSLYRLAEGKAYFRKEEFFLIVQRCGAEAIGLVSLISFLVGMILAFIGAIQLRMFGAQVFIADIVGIAMVRVMGAVMTGVLLSGRTGASFAAELGIMQSNEEIDALRTLGLNPVELLVMPRVLALMLMMPLLNLYAGLMGILGGLTVSVGLIGINPVEYFNHTQSAVKLSYVWVGLIHSFVFGIIIAVCGCLKGMNCQRSAEGLGLSTTSAVVTSITWIVIATAVITYLCQVLGI